MVDKVRSVCPFCGCGCYLNFLIKNKKVIGVEAIREDICSQGKPCIKGMSSYEGWNKNRILSPMIRKKGILVKCSWNEAYAEIYRKFSGLGPHETYFLGSGEMTNEANYILQKLARKVFRTGNIDSSARLCHAATTLAFDRVFGIDRVPNCMDDVSGADLFLIVGSNPASNYPVFFNRILNEKKKGAKLICVEIEASETTNSADVALKITPSGQIAFLAGLLNYLMEYANEYVKKISGFSRLRDAVGDISIEYAASSCGVSVKSFISVAKMVMDSKKLVICHGMGITQHVNGSQNALALADIALLKNAVLLPLRGKANIQGCGDMGCTPFSQEKKGEPITRAMFDPFVKAIYIMGMNPAKSMPNLNEVDKRLHKMFVIYHHHHKSAMMKYADVVIPSPMLFEEEGTITNGESRVRKTADVAKTGVKPNWKILSEIGKIFSAEGFNFSSAREVFDEIKKSIRRYSRLDWERISSMQDNFADKTLRKKKFAVFNHELPIELEGSSGYPFILTTSRVPYHFCTGEVTLNCRTLLKNASKPLLKMSSHDAKRLNINGGEKVRVESVVGKITVSTVIDPQMTKGLVNLPFHFDSVLVNKLVPSQGLDSECETPNYKSVKVKITKLKK